MAGGGRWQDAPAHAQLLRATAATTGGLYLAPAADRLEGRATPRGG
jgi:hypothetical protein